MTAKKAPKPTRKQLKRQLKEALAQQAHAYTFAHDNLDRMSLDRMMGSAVMLEITTLGGREVTGPVAIRDGLSSATIEAIKADLRRSYEVATAFKPKEPTR